MNKSELRKLYLGKRRLFTPAERAEAGNEIVAKFFGSFQLNATKFLHCYIPIEKFKELDTKPIFERVWAEFPQITTVAPRINYETGEMESVIYGPDAGLELSRWQIYEPKQGALVEPGEIDLVLVPLVCFDRCGHRVGYGKGYYDRFLSKCRPDCLKVGLSFFGPVDEISDAREGDVRLDFCVTPDSCYAFDESNAT